jgi:hypothetical protein
MSVLYKETQRFSFATLIVSLPVFVIICLNLYNKHQTSFLTTLSQNIHLIIVLGVVGLVLFFSLSAKMKTQITDKGVSVKFFPVLFKTKTILWVDVEDFFVREYNPLQEFGGWGLFRINLPFGRGLGNSRAIALRGSHGLQLIMKDGSRLLIGTQEPEKLKHLKINHHL